MNCIIKNQIKFFLEVQLLGLNSVFFIKKTKTTVPTCNNWVSFYSATIRVAVILWITAQYENKIQYWKILKSYLDFQCFFKLEDYSFKVVVDEYAGKKPRKQTHLVYVSEFGFGRDKCYFQMKGNFLLKIEAANICLSDDLNRVRTWRHSRRIWTNTLYFS